MKLVTQLSELHTELQLVVDLLCFVDEKGKGGECDTSFKKIRALSKNTIVLRELAVFQVHFLLNFEKSTIAYVCLLEIVSEFKLPTNEHNSAFLSSKRSNYF